MANENSRFIFRLVTGYNLLWSSSWQSTSLLLLKQANGISCCIIGNNELANHINRSMQSREICSIDHTYIALQYFQSCPLY